MKRSTPLLMSTVCTTVASIVARGPVIRTQVLAANVGPYLTHIRQHIRRCQGFVTAVRYPRSHPRPRPRVRQLVSRQFQPGEMRVQTAGTRARRTADVTGVARQATAAAIAGCSAPETAAGTPPRITGTTDANTRRKWTWRPRTSRRQRASRRRKASRKPR